MIGRFLLWVVTLCGGIQVISAQPGVIQSFTVKESLMENDRISVVATDSANVPNDAINGTYQFSVNSFRHQLSFKDGSALVPQAIEGSAFVLIKHKNVEGSQAKLFFIYKNKQGLKPAYIPWYWLIFVPALLLLIGYVFKKLLLLAVILVVGIFIFNYSKGLDLQNIFETLSHGIMSLMGGK